MSALDPRDYDPRDNGRPTATSRGSRGASGNRNRGHDWAQPGTRTRDRDDARTLGRGPGNERQASGQHGRSARADARWPEGDRDDRAREQEPRDAFTRHLRLPRGPDREIVRDRDREYRLRGSESRTLATVGAFRVVSCADVRDQHGRTADPRSGDLRHLRAEGLIETARVPGSRDLAIVLTRSGRDLLESVRNREHGPQQRFYAGLKRERELGHDIQLYRAFEQEAEGLHEHGARLERVVLDYELKSEYQRWLHARDGERDDYDGHPDRTAEEVAAWAREHDLPYFDDEVHFPDVRIEYEGPDGRWDHRDIEVVTEHYRGAHGASVGRSGFSCYQGVSLCIGGGGGGGSNRSGGRSRRRAEERWP